MAIQQHHHISVQEQLYYGEQQGTYLPQLGDGVGEFTLIYRRL